MKFLIVCVLFGAACAGHVQDLDTTKGHSSKAAMTFKGKLCVGNNCNLLECNGISDWETEHHSRHSNFKTLLASDYFSNRALCDPETCQRDCGRYDGVCFRNIDMCCCFNAAARNMGGLLALLVALLCTRCLW